MIRTYQHKLSSSTLVVRRVYTAGAHQRGSASYLSSRQRAMNKDTCNDKWVVYILQSKWVRTDDLGFSAFWLPRELNIRSVKQTTLRRQRYEVHVVMLCRTASQKEENNIWLARTWESGLI